MAMDLLMFRKALLLFQGLLRNREEGQEIEKINAIRPADSFRRVSAVLETIVSTCISIKVLLHRRLIMLSHLLRLMEHGMLGTRKRHNHRLCIPVLLLLYREPLDLSVVAAVPAAHLGRARL